MATVHTVTIAEETPKIRIHADYPVLSGLPDPAVQAQINRLLRVEADRIAGAGREAIRNATIHPPPPLPPGRWEFLSQYQVTFNEHGLISVVFDNYTFTGGAHGSPERVSYTFVLATGALLALADVFADTPGWLDRTNDAIRRDLAARQLPLINPFISIRPDQPFYLQDGAAYVYFGLYEYTPYYVGQPAFRVPVPLHLGPAAAGSNLSLPHPWPMLEGTRPQDQE